MVNDEYLNDTNDCVKYFRKYSSRWVKYITTHRCVSLAQNGITQFDTLINRSN